MDEIGGGAVLPAALGGDLVGLLLAVDAGHRGDAGGDAVGFDTERRLRRLTGQHGLEQAGLGQEDDDETDADGGRQPAEDA